MRMREEEIERLSETRFLFIAYVYTSEWRELVIEWEGKKSAEMIVSSCSLVTFVSFENERKKYRGRKKDRKEI